MNIPEMLPELVLMRIALLFVICILNVFVENDLWGGIVIFIISGCFIMTLVELSAAIRYLLIILDQRIVVLQFFHHIDCVACITDFEKRFESFT